MLERACDSQENKNGDNKARFPEIFQGHAHNLGFSKRLVFL